MIEFASSITRFLFITLLLNICSYVLVSPSLATRIYKSIDAEGNVTYSSYPPANAEVFERIYMPDFFDADALPADSTRHDEIKAAAKQLEADRKERQKEREAARKKLAEENKQQYQPAPQQEIHYYPLYPLYYYPYPHRPKPPRPPFQPRPPHPHPHPHQPKPAPLPSPHPR